MVLLSIHNTSWMIELQTVLCWKSAEAEINPTKHQKLKELVEKGDKWWCLVVSVSCSKLAELLHAAFISVEKHCSVIFSLGCFLFSRSNACKKGKPLGKPSGLLHKLKLCNVSKTKQNFSGKKTTGYCLLPFSSYREQLTFFHFALSHAFKHSIRIQQNIDLLQCVTSKMLISG